MFFPVAALGLGQAFQQADSAGDGAIGGLRERAGPTGPAHQLPWQELVLMYPLMPSDLNNGTAENLSLLQRDAGVLDVFQGISIGHELP